MSASSINYSASFHSSQARLQPLRRLDQGQQSYYDYTYKQGVSVHEPKRVSAAFRPSKSNPSLATRKNRHKEPFGGGDWVVPRVPPPKVFAPRKVFGKPISGSNSTSSLASLHSDKSWREVPGAMKFAAGGGRVGARFETLPEGFMTGALPSLMTF